MITDESLLPEHEAPVAGQRDRAEQGGDEGRPPDVRAEQAHHRRYLPLTLLRRPLFRLGDFLADPERDEGGQDTDEEDPARLVARNLLQQEDGGDRGEDAEIHGALEDGRDPRAPLLRPGLGKERSADGPFAADTERGEETEDHQLPPSLREERKAREQRVGQDGQDQRATAAEPVADDAEEGAAQGPAEQERRLDPRAVERHGRVGLLDHEQLGHEDRGDERIQVQVEAVEEPTEPGGEA